MTEREAELLRIVEERRQTLIRTAGELGRRLSALDPRSYVREDPVGGVLACLTAGITIGLLAPGRAPRGGSGSDGARGRTQPLVGLALTALGPLVPILLEALRTARADDGRGGSTS